MKRTISCVDQPSYRTSRTKKNKGIGWLLGAKIQTSPTSFTLDKIYLKTKQEVIEKIMSFDNTVQIIFCNVVTHIDETKNNIPIYHMIEKIDEYGNSVLPEWVRMTGT